MGFYQANRAQVDRIVAGTQVSSFAAGWITTIARATELGLDKVGPSDFTGGLAGFFQSLGVAATGTAVHYEDVGARLSADGSVTLTARGSADGLFAGLPGHLDGPVGDDVANPRFQQGMAGWRLDDNAPAGWGVDLSSGDTNWWGSGNDAIWSHLEGTPAAGALADIRSDWMPATAGHLYEASVYAAQHRGQAQLWMEYYDAGKGLLAATMLGAGGAEGGGRDGALASYASLSGTATAPAGAAFRRLVLRDMATGGADPFAFFTRPESHDVTAATDLANPRFLGGLAGARGGRVRQRLMSQSSRTLEGTARRRRRWCKQLPHFRNEAGSPLRLRMSHSSCSK